MQKEFSIPPVPEAFLDRMRKQLGSEYESFVESLEEVPPVSVRLHPERGPDLWPEVPVVSWHKAGRYLSERPVFTLDPLFHAGAYYVQEASSMLIAPVIQALLPGDRPWRVLDLCAAPGGKSTLLTTLLPEGSLLVANEVIAGRTAVLRHNLQKWGYANVVVTRADVREFRALDGFFDLVLVDAPCSGEGMFRKDPSARTEWSEEHVHFCAARQGRILQDVPDLLADDGLLVYATCTYNAEENENQAGMLAEWPGLTHLEPDFPTDWGLRKCRYGYKAFPHHLQGEGFFLAAFRKSSGNTSGTSSHDRSAFDMLSGKERSIVEDWISPSQNWSLFRDYQGSVRILPESVVEDAGRVVKAIRKSWAGTEIGQLKGALFLPGQGLATSRHLSPNAGRIDLTREQALRFLKGESFPPDSDWPSGWQLMSFQGRGLGWAKVLPNRINNYFPKADRIRMDI